MRTINRVTLLGNVGQDPEFRSPKNGDKEREIAIFYLATDDRKKSRDGNWIDETDWHLVVVFDQTLIQFIKNNVQKGTTLHVEGLLKPREWKTKEGLLKNSVEIQVLPFHGSVRLASQSELEEKKNHENEREI